MVFAVVLPHVANQVGWVAAEVGRQPWIVYGLMRTADGLSESVKGGQIVASLILFALVYALLFALFLYLLDQKIKAGPTETTKTGPATVNAADQLHVHLTTRNNGPSTATAVVIRDTLPATVTFVSATNGGVLGAGNVVTWPAIATIASGATVARSVTVTSPAERHAAQHRGQQLDDG